MDAIRNLLGGDVVEAGAGVTAEWEPGHVRVRFPSGRSHDVRYRLDEHWCVFRARVANHASLEHIGERRLAQEILLRNRTAECVGFYLTPRGHLDALIKQRASTLHRDELVYYLTQLAREADRLEHLLVGGDRW